MSDLGLEPFEWGQDEKKSHTQTIHKKAMLIWTQHNACFLSQVHCAVYNTRYIRLTVCGHFLWYMAWLLLYYFFLPLPTWWIGFLHIYVTSFVCAAWCGYFEPLLVFVDSRAVVTFQSSKFTKVWFYKDYKKCKSLKYWKIWKCELFLINEQHFLGCLPSPRQDAGLV